VIGAFLFANGGAVFVGPVLEGFALPALAVVSMRDAISGGIGGAAGLTGAYVNGARSGTGSAGSGGDGVRRTFPRTHNHNPIPCRAAAVAVAPISVAE
jgi:hypothetical protein